MEEELIIKSRLDQLRIVDYGEGANGDFIPVSINVYQAIKFQTCNIQISYKQAEELRNFLDSILKNTQTK